MADTVWIMVTDVVEVKRAALVRPLVLFRKSYRVELFEGGVTFVVPLVGHKRGDRRPSWLSAYVYGKDEVVPTTVEGVMGNPRYGRSPVGDSDPMLGDDVPEQEYSVSVNCSDFFELDGTSAWVKGVLVAGY